MLAILFATACFIAATESCKKWSDPAPGDNSQINNPYCNDPDAVNYNWGFPGKPDNSVCYYGPDLFQGTYLYKDSTYANQSDLYLAADSLYLTITKTNNKQINVSGLCSGGGSLSMTTTSAYVADVDTTVGDTTTLHPGQLFCRTQDTVVGTFTRDKVDSSLIYVQLTIYSDTGVTVRKGRAVRK